MSAGGGGDAENGAFLSAISVRNIASSGGDIFIAHDFVENLGQLQDNPCVTGETPFFVISSRLRIGQMLGKNQVHGRGAGVMPKMGHP